MSEISREKFQSNKEKYSICQIIQRIIQRKDIFERLRILERITKKKQFDFKNMYSNIK